HLLQIRPYSLPYFADELAAHVLAAGPRAREDTARRGDDDDAHAAERTRDLGGAGVQASPRRREAPQVRQHRTAPLGVLQMHANGLEAPVGHDLEALDEALVLQDPRDAFFHLRVRDVNAGMAPVNRVADARQHIGDRIGHTHGIALPTSSTSQRPAARPAAPVRAGRCGKGRTCDTRPVGAHTPGSGYVAAP